MRRACFLCLFALLLALPTLAQDRWRTDVEQIYLYTQEGKSDKADKLFNQALRDLPENRNAIVNISMMFRNKALYDYAMAVLDKGAKINTDRDPLYMEKATLCQTMNNYSDAFEYYLLELERKPDLYGTIRSRFYTMLLYDVNKSIADEMRIALLKKTQEKPNNNEYAALLVWFAIQQEDYETALIQCISLDRRNNDQDEQITNLADICYNNGQYGLAKEAYDHVLTKGKINPFYGRALIGSIKAEDQIYRNSPTTTVKNYQKLSEKIEAAYSDVGSKEYPGLAEIQADLMTYRLEQPEQAIALLQQVMEQTHDKNQINQLKLKLADIYLFIDEIWEATLLYSQVDKAMKEAPMGHEARFRNARLR